MAGIDGFIKEKTESLTAMAKVYAHRFTDTVQLYRFNRGDIVNASLIKRIEVRNYGKQYGCNVLVETGTYLGEMPEFQRHSFERIYSIEISDFYYNFSRKRLSGYGNIKILHGDSGLLLEKVVSRLRESDVALFWLDGHYSGGNTGKGENNTPIMNELNIIFGSQRNDIILIDDARCFNGEGGYPSLEEVRKLAEENGRKYEMFNDIIRLTPC